VESWVVLAIGRGLLDARMDQGARTITVTRTLQREFGPAQWAALQTKLRQWTDNVASLLTTIEGGGSGGGGGARN
jgi:translation initiation factor 3 subunit M